MNIGMISTRFAGTDGVSLEAAKLAHVLEDMGHTIAYCAGELDEGLPGLEVPELHFEDPVSQELSARAFSVGEPDNTLLPDIAHRAAELRDPLNAFIREFDIEYVIAQNIFAIPMQLPAQALGDILAETGLPGLAHNHDLYWERERFTHHQLGEFLDTYFPPDLPRLCQAVINSLAQDALYRRRGLESVILPNVFDFENPPPPADAYAQSFRQAIGLTDEDRLILQPTRVIPRKGIELAIDLVARLDDPRAKLIITHRAGDEGLDYLRFLERTAAERGVDLRYVADIVDSQRGEMADGRPVFTLWDTYAAADFVTYPSYIEGFGNALLETIYFRLPAMVNRYPVYTADIGPKGFNFVEIDGQVTDETVRDVQALLEDPALVRRMVDHNYQIALEHYSYRALAASVAPCLP
ncbi:MAG: glycosyltransferase family 4 protein [Chloroflexota bacterium]